MNKTNIIIGLASLVVILSLVFALNFWRERARTWEQAASFEAAKTDTVWVPATYDVVVDTVPVYVEAPPQVDTVPLATPFKQFRHVIRFDTTKQFGPTCNPLSVRVRGEFNCPDAYKRYNWIQVMPSYAETKATTMTQPPMIPGHLFSIAIGYYYANGNANGPLIGFDMGKLDFQIGYNFQSKGMLMGIGWKFLQF